MNDDRREREELSKLDQLFRADPGPTSSDLAEARLKLKRALARDAAPRGSGAPQSTLVRLAPRRPLWIASQAAGFALLVALLAPIVPRLLPAGARAPASADLVAGFVSGLADDARAVHARLKPWLPTLPSLPTFPLPSLHSDAR